MIKWEYNQTSRIQTVIMINATLLLEVHNKSPKIGRQVDLSRSNQVNPSLCNFYYDYQLTWNKAIDHSNSCCLDSGLRPELGLRHLPIVISNPLKTKQKIKIFHSKYKRSDELYANPYPTSSLSLFTYIILQSLYYVLTFVVSHWRKAVLLENKFFFHVCISILTKLVVTQARVHSPWGKDHFTAGLQFSKIGFDQKKKICCYLYVVKHLSLNLWNWRPAVQWYFPQRWVFSAPTFLYRNHLLPSSTSTKIILFFFFLR